MRLIFTPLAQQVLTQGTWGGEGGGREGGPVVEQAVCRLIKGK